MTTSWQWDEDEQGMSQGRKMTRGSPNFPVGERGDMFHWLPASASTEARGITWDAPGGTTRHDELHILG